jgi:hypothetical protein
MPGVRISQAHGTSRIADPATGARDATAFAMYHPAAALRTTAIERESYEDVALIPAVLTEARARRAAGRDAARSATAAPSVTTARPGTAARPDVPAGSVPATTPDATTTPDQPSHATDAVSSPTTPDPEPAADQLSLF